MARVVKSEDVYASVEMFADRGVTLTEIAVDLFGPDIVEADDYKAVLLTISKRLTGTLNALEPRFTAIREPNSEADRWYVSEFSPEARKKTQKVGKPTGFDPGIRTTPYTVGIRGIQDTDPGVVVAIHRDPFCVQGVLKLQIQRANNQWEQIPLFVSMEIWITSGEEPILHPRQISMRGLLAIQLEYRDPDNNNRGRQEEIRINKDQIVVVTPMTTKKK